MSWLAARGKLRVAMSGAAAIVVGATVYWALRSEIPAATENFQLGTQSSVEARGAWPGNRDDSIESPPPNLTVSAPSAAPDGVAVDSEESTITDYIAEKYRYLFDDLRYLDAGKVEELKRALLARERLAGQASDPSAMADVEAGIRALLRPDDYATYEMLRESDLELFKLNEYAAGISNVAPLSAADRESILRTKLAYKQRFAQLLADSGLHRQDLSPTEREYAYSVTSRALEGYRQSYLEEVRQYLTNDEQFALLSNYETTEFKAELAKLRSMVDVPIQGGS
jgi:hypothetical protein